LAVKGSLICKDDWGRQAPFGIEVDLEVNIVFLRSLWSTVTVRRK
jgi:hypothetical protein